MRILRYIHLLLAIGLLCTSCEHKDFCYYHPHNAKVRLNVDWSNFTVEQPTGMTVLVYNEEGEDGEIHSTMLSNNISYVDLMIRAGQYKAIVFNQSQTEFGTLSFRGLDKFSTAEIQARATTSHWYTRLDETRVVSELEWVGTDKQEGIAVAKEMVDETVSEQQQKVHSRSSLATRTVIGELRPQNIIHTVNVRVHVKNVYNMLSARASLGGLAEGYMLGLGRPSQNKVVQLLEEWSMTQDKVDPSQGVIEAKITCFGLPYGHQGVAEDNLFELQLLLVDKKTIVTYPFYVGDKFERDIEESVGIELELHLDLTLEEPLPDVEPAGGSGGGGFSADVQDWGPEENIDVQM